MQDTLKFKMKVPVNLNKFMSRCITGKAGCRHSFHANMTKICDRIERGKNV